MAKLKHFKEFETYSEYETYINGKPMLPNVSFVGEKVNHIQKIILILVQIQVKLNQRIQVSIIHMILTILPLHLNLQEL